MSNYESDRAFTEYVHEKLAIPIIYDKLSWFEDKLNPKVVDNVDLFNAIDRFLIDAIKKRIITVQERFREYKYHNYNDFTIRYKRDFSKYEERKKSEFFKLDCAYFVYGIINTSKKDVQYATDFVKFAVIDIEVFKKLLDDGEIVLDQNIRNKKCTVIDNKLHCPIITNFDRSSSFVPIDIKMMLDLFPNRKIIISQKGFK